MAVRQAFSGTTLRARRTELGLSRDFVAWAVGRTVGSIANYETGATTPSADIVAALADVLEITPADLFDQASVDA